MKNYPAIIALALALPAGLANAQQPEGRPPGPPTGEGRPPTHRPFDGPGRAEKPPMPHMPPFFAALDKNGDGVISEDEIAVASESLRKLASEHGGKLTIRDLLGPPPQAMRGDGLRPPGAPPDGQPPRPNFNDAPDGQREDGGPRRIAPPQGGPREGFAPPRDGEKPRNADRPRDGVRPEGALRDGERKPEGFRPRDGEQPRNADRQRDGEKPKDGDRPRDGERGDKPRADTPLGGRPPGDAPRPDGERRPNPEG